MNTVVSLLAGRFASVESIKRGGENMYKKAKVVRVVLKASQCMCYLV